MTGNAYHGDPTLKVAVLAEMAGHRAADTLIRGTYWTNGRGCAVGCLTRDPHGGHAEYPARWGIPEELAWLEDQIFEELPREHRMAWPERFLAAIEPGADLSRVRAAWTAVLMLDPERGNIARCAGFPDAEAAVRQVGELWQGISTESTETAESVRSAVLAAGSARLATELVAAATEATEATHPAELAAWSAAESGESAASAARAARAESAVDSAELVAWATAESGELAASAARAAAESAESAADPDGQEHWQWMADTLIAAIQTAPTQTPGRR